MLFYTHLVLGILVYLIVHNFFSGGNEILFFLLILLGSILPDIDEGSSIMNRKAGVIGDIFSFFFRHRGLFHSVFLALIVFFILRHFWNTYYAIGLLLGYAAHLVGDSFSPMGIQLLYPFSKFKVKGPMKVGGILEGIIFILLLVFIIVIMKRII